MVWLFALVIGLALGFVTGGKISNLARLQFRLPLLLVAAVLLRYSVVLTPLSRVEGIQYVYALSLALIVLWTVWHLRRLPGVWLVTAGGTLNLIVVLANGGRMPVEATLAARQLGGLLVQRGHLGQYTLMGPNTNLAPLGDWLSIGNSPEAFSPGDVLIGLGIVLVILVAMRRKPEPEVVP